MQKIKVVKEDGTEEEIEVAEIYKTQEDLDKALKSANSQGKNEILKTLEVTSVEEAKAKMTKGSKVDELMGTITALQQGLEKETHLRMANEIGIKPDLVDDVLTLAKASMHDGDDFATVLKAKAEKLGAIGSKETNTAGDNAKKYGNPKSPEDIALKKQEDAEMARLRTLGPLSGY